MKQLTKTSDYTGKIANPITRYGTVKVIGGKHKGKIGEITSIYNDGDLYVKFGTSDDSVMVQLKDVKATVAKPKAPEKLLKNQNMILLQC